MPSTPKELALQVVTSLRDHPKLPRLIALAGPPGAGKSTIADAIAAEFDAIGRHAQVIPMDGFHLDNCRLDARGLRDRKGAPETFDAAGFAHLVSRIASGEPNVVFPVFDRHRDISVAGAGVIDPQTDVLIFEGNYLLLDDAPWSELTNHWDYAVWIDVPEPVLIERLMQRWLDEGLSEDAARVKVMQSDIPNARMVSAKSRAADLTVS